MKGHFSSEEWVDFARALAPAPDAALMQRHLHEGCRPCTYEAHVWERVAEVARRESRYTPPPGAVRCAKSLYRMFPPEKSAGLKIILARLFLPSTPRMAMAGVRGVLSLSPHLLFKRGDLMLDLLIEPREERDLVSMAGQINGPAADRRSFGSRPVALLRGRDELARAVTNQFGEFHLDFAPSDDLMLVVDLHREIFLVSPLPIGPQSPAVAARGSL